MSDLIKTFLENNKLVTIATEDSGNPWICNVYYASDDDLNLYFLSSIEENHSKHIEENNNIAFTVVWFNPDNLSDRKSVQAKGKIEIVGVGKELIHGLKIYTKKFGRNYKELHNELEHKLSDMRLYVIRTSYIKYWDDEQKKLGNDRVQEFNF
ncbi:pyridoxamine 5'-phosphate oxidase family protein [Candidatus Dojkabacteria bacterium]|uniref:Pyridoxamine 5'-phosphate oxidase family protein n=1 Tax=Candidatus Dojkabacteria bacterium TaxID=2099670 RepID=A0A955L0B4_9BACT|nr:pyridoxamine 5'-phosphate oxidase family protein [Candidatus Dojkabacteria bacterium]